MQDGLDGVRALLPGTRLEVVDVLGGSSRSLVRRVQADSRTVIVKEFTGTGEGWVRESAGLSVMPAEAPVPRLVAAAAVPPTVVMSDVGAGASVADALLGPDPVCAADAVVSWATALATLHRATAGSRQAFRAALTVRAGDRTVAESTIAADLDAAARVVEEHCTQLGVEVPDQAPRELRELAARLDGTGPAAITPADACPDNNVFTGDALVLIDFEGAQWRHIAWDVAYLIVPWPSCWCAWQIPADVADQAIDAYRAALALPYVDSPRFRADVAAAAVGWAYVSASWFLPRALHDEPAPTNPAKPAPNRRALILHRLRQAQHSAELPALADLAARLHDALARRWGGSTLAYAPAFTRQR